MSATSDTSALINEGDNRPLAPASGSGAPQEAAIPGAGYEQASPRGTLQQVVGEGRGAKVSASPNEGASAEVFEDEGDAALAALIRAADEGKTTYALFVVVPHVMQNNDDVKVQQDRITIARELLDLAHVPREQIQTVRMTPWYVQKIARTETDAASATSESESIFNVMQIDVWDEWALQNLDCLARNGTAQLTLVLPYSQWSQMKNERVTVRAGMSWDSAQLVPHGYAVVPAHEGCLVRVGLERLPLVKNLTDPRQVEAAGKLVCTRMKGWWARVLGADAPACEFLQACTRYTAKKGDTHMIATAADITIRFPGGTVPKVAPIRVQMAPSALALLYFDYKGARMKDWAFQPPPGWQPGTGSRKSGAEQRNVQRSREQRDPADLLAEDHVANTRIHAKGMEMEGPAGDRFRALFAAWGPPRLKPEQLCMATMMRVASAPTAGIVTCPEHHKHGECRIQGYPCCKSATDGPDGPKLPRFEDLRTQQEWRDDQQWHTASHGRRANGDGKGKGKGKGKDAKGKGAGAKGKGAGKAGPPNGKAPEPTLDDVMSARRFQPPADDLLNQLMGSEPPRSPVAPASGRHKRGTPDREEEGPRGSAEDHVARHAISPALRDGALADMTVEDGEVFFEAQEGDGLVDESGLLDYSQYADNSLSQTVTGEDL